jgi:hypothetical protein
VYTSDIKKLASWYNLLHNLNLLIKDEPKDEAEVATKEKKTPKTKKAAVAKPKKKATLTTKKDKA